jgi:hypothetical protein
MSDITLVPAGGVPLGVGLGSGDHILGSVGGEARRLSIDALYAAMEGLPLNTRVFNLASRAAVQGFAATMPAPGTVATHPGAAYRYLGSGSVIPDLPGWAPEDIVTPRHMGAVLDGTTDDAEALREADEYVAANEGKVLVLDGAIGLLSPVSLRSRSVICRGVIRPLLGFDATDGWVIRLGENTGINSGHNARLIGDLFFDGFDFCGRAVNSWSPSSGSFPTTGFDGGPILAGDSYKVLDGAVVDGTNFNTAHRLVALKDAPSSSTFAGNWARRANLTMVDVQGLARPFPAITVQAMNADRVLTVEGNSEKGRFDVSGWFCHSLVHEAAYSGSSPDNNSYFIRGNDFGTAYSSTGPIVSDVTLETQVQLPGYGLPVLDVRSTRQVTFQGTIRSPSNTAVYVEQDPAIENTGVQFLGLSVINPKNTGFPWLHVRTGRIVHGSLNVKQPYEGAEIREAEGVDIRLNIDNQKAGRLYTLGREDNAQAVKRGRVVVTVNAPDAGVTGGRLSRITDLVVEHLGACPAMVAVNPTRSKVILPARAFIDAASGTPITRPNGLSVEYVGTDQASVGQTTSKSTGVTVNALECFVSTHNETMASGATAIFRVTNNRVERGDHVIVDVRDPPGAYSAVTCGKGLGFFDVALTRVGSGSGSHGVEIHFLVVKGSVVT